MGATTHTVTLYEIPGALADIGGYRLYRFTVTGTIADDDILAFPAPTDVLIVGARNQDGEHIEFDDKSTATAGQVRYTVDTTTATTVAGVVLVK
jgi:hypothetical protein